MSMKPLDELYPIIEKRKGLWGYRIELGKDDKGVRKQKTSFKKSYKTQKIAKIEALKWIEEYRKNQGYIPPDSVYKISDFIDIYLEYYINENKNKLKPSTIRTRMNYVNKIKEVFGEYYIDKLSKSNYQKILTELLMQHYSESYVNSIHVQMKMMYQYAYNSKLVTTNITNHGISTKKPNIYAKEKNDLFRKFFNLEELNEFLSLTKENLDYRFYTALWLLGHTGMRPGECLALKWEDIDFCNKTISVYKTIFHDNGRTDGWVLLTPKTEKAKRIVEIRDIDIEKLEKWKQMQLIEWNTRNKKVRSLDSDFVITHTRYPGYPMDRSTLSWNMKKIIKLGNYNEKITPHKLRHTHISILAEAGASLSEIKARVGHSQEKTTERIYLHYTKNVSRKALEIYETYLMEDKC